MTTKHIIRHETTTQQGEWIVERNDVLNKMKKYTPSVQQLVLADEDFQAALDALDPFSPSFIKDRKLRRIIAQGCFYRLEIVASID